VPDAAEQRQTDQRPGPTLPRWVNVADALAVGLLAAFAYVLAFGGGRFELGGFRVSITSPFRLLIELALVVALRHAAYRQPSLLARATHAVSRVSERQWAVLAVFVGTRLLVLLVGYVAVVGIGYPKDAPQWRTSVDEFWNLPARWDAGWYLGIALDGYAWNPADSGQQNLAFFPAVPLLMRGAAWVVWRDAEDPSKMVWAGTLVALVAVFAGFAYFFSLARDCIGEEAGIAALTLLASYPFAVFYSASYTESLFLLTVVAAFSHFRRSQLGRAACWGLLAGLARPNGCLLSVPLAILAVPGIDRLLGGASSSPSQEAMPIAGSVGWRRVLLRLMAASTPGVGMLIFSAYVFWLTGHPLTWIQAAASWGRDFGGLSMIRDDLSSLRTLGVFGFVTAKPIVALNAMGALFGLLTIWPVTRRLGLAFGVFVLLNIMLPVTSGGLVSIGRYSSVLFPSFIWLGATTPPPLRPALIALFAMGQGLVAVLFFTWRALY